MKSFSTISRFIGVAICLCAPLAHAAPSCIVYGIDENGFQQRCKDSDMRSSSGNSYPTFGDAILVNPGSIPVEPTPFGVEILGSTRSDFVSGADFSVSLIRGFSGFGMGFVSNPDNTFFANPSLSSFSSPENVSFRLPSISAGGALVLAEKFFGTSFKPILGAALRTNTVASSGYSVGLNLVSSWISAGVSYQKGPPNAFLINETSMTLNLGLALGALDLDITYGNLNYDYQLLDSRFYSFTGSASLSLGQFASTVAYRSILDPASLGSRAWMFSVIYRVYAKLRVAYLLNYRVGSHSLGVQALLF